MMLTFFREQFFGRPVAPTQSLEGRIVLVTGGNCGLGLQTAIHLAKLHPKKVIITSRDAKKGEDALRKIKEASGYTSAESWELDLSSFNSVLALAERCKSLERLDCVVENAGVTGFDWKLTEDGWEHILQVNGIATGLLGVLLLPLLQKAATLPSPASSVAFRPHLTIVSSELHAMAKFEEAKKGGLALAALNDEKSWSKVKMDRYNVTKLLNAYVAQGISKLPAASGVTVNFVNPGLCVSDLRKDFKGILAIAGRVMDLMARTAECGSRNIAWAATEPTPPAAYISVCAVQTPGKLVTSDKGKALQAKVWSELVQEWRKVAPETQRVL